MASTLLHSTLRERLAAVRAADHFEACPVITVEPSEDLAGAFRKILKANILSAPVETASGPGRYAGFLELLDLTSTLVQSYRDIHATTSTIPASPQGMDLDALLGERFVQSGSRSPEKRVPGAQLVSPGYLAQIKRLIAIDSASTLLSVCESLSSGSCRRVALVE